MQKNPEPLAWFRGHRGGVSCLAFFRSSLFFVSGDYEGDIILWSSEAKRMVKSFQESHLGGVLQVCTCNYSCIGSQLWVSQGRVDGNFKIYLEDSLINVFRLESESFCRTSVLFLPECNDFFLACTKLRNPEVVCVWDSAHMLSPQFECIVADSNIKTGMVMDCHLVSPHLLIAAYEDGFLRVFRDGEEMIEMAIGVQPFSVPVTSFAFNVATGRGLCGGASSELTKFSLEFSPPKARALGTIPVLATAVDSSNDKMGRGVSQIALRPDARICAVASWDHRVRILHWQTLKPLAVLKAHRDSATCVAFSKNSMWLLTGSKDRNIALWSLYPPENISEAND